MARPPPSTAGSSRPYTSNGARPTTAAGNGALFDHNPQYTYDPDYDLDEEEEESDDEDVFAFLPPTTAEQQEQQRQQEQINHDYPAHYPTDRHSTDHIFANSAVSPQITYPSPTFDPYARFPADSLAGTGPSTPHFHYFQPPPQTPPSTDSNNHHTLDGQYPLRRLNTAAESVISHVPTTAESREVRVALPGGSRASGIISEKDFDMEAGTSRRRSQPKGDVSIGDSLSIDRSMLDDDDSSREGSIK